MSYDYERYDGKRIVVDGEVIGLLAMEFGHEVEEVWEEYHAELAMTEEQERQSEAYKESLRRTLSAQYEKVATLEAENAKLREELAKWERLAAGIDLPEYPVTQFKPKDLERENEKLRKLCVKALKWSRWAGGITCPPEVPVKFADELRDLGVEVE